MISNKDSTIVYLNVMRDIETEENAEQTISMLEKKIIEINALYCHYYERCREMEEKFGSIK